MLRGALNGKEYDKEMQGSGVRVYGLGLFWPLVS